MIGTGTEGYRVLARKYRPETFGDLVGQDAMVQTLRNAFHAGRIAQAFIMTGIRGTGKTTTARIIAKGLNCVGSDGNGGPTIDPCGKCEHCEAIIEGRHVDVVEMDAASRTGVNDVREIIESVQYRAIMARHKIYIIDEVHMLSTNAFNALLKTLEEPPEHVKFIFATTEIRKVPVTVLSRCQRFDLRRIQPEEMLAMLDRIAKAEGAQIEEAALKLIVRAAEGSARDATSLLDQAISHGAGETSEEQVRAMLGLADRGRVTDLLDMILRGDAKAALAEFASQYHAGAEPLAIFGDLAEVTNWLSMIKITPDQADDHAVAPDERIRGKRMAGELEMRSLTRMWQMLVRALEEISAAPNPRMAAEMAVIRMTHVADLPSPEELVRNLRKTPAQGNGRRSGPSEPGGGETRTRSDQGSDSRAEVARETSDGPVQPEGFANMLELIRKNREMKLLMDVENHVRLVSYQPERITVQLTSEAPSGLVQGLGTCLQRLTGRRWSVVVVNEGGGETVAEMRDAARRESRRKAEEHPLVKEVFAHFPDARIIAIRTPEKIDTPDGTAEFPEEEGTPDIYTWGLAEGA